MNKIKITEEQAREMAKYSTQPVYVVKEWKEAGYIKKTTLEEARDKRDALKEQMFTMLGVNRADVIAVFALYEAAIKELQGE